MSGITKRTSILFLIFSISLLIFSLPGYAAEVSLSWEKPGDSRVTGYNIYYAEKGADFQAPYTSVNSSDTTTCVISGLERGYEYSFAATSFDANGNESDFSEVIHYLVKAEDETDNDGDGYTESQGDCNDNDPSIHPDATEICGDGIDQNCSGTDLSCLEDPFEADNDGDGYSTEEGDCNDNDATIFPGAIEICGDGIDQDCSGSDLKCTGDDEADFSSLYVNFQPEDAEVPEGYALDNGRAFSEYSGYGWIQGPAGIGTRDRNDSASPDQSYDTMIHVNPSSKWEAELPNGSYEVTICMGDPSYPKDIQNVQVEDISLIEDEELSPDKRWIEKKTIAEVKDGRLTVAFGDSDDWNRLSWIKIDRINTQPNTSQLAVNFQPEEAKVPEGYTLDNGGAFDERSGYGWVQGPAGIGTRDRDSSESPDQSYDTMIHVNPSSIWEAELPNGTYKVTICMGDPSYPKDIQNVQVEGMTLIRDEGLSPDKRWIEKETVAEVKDGRLTISFGESDDWNRLCWIKIDQDNTQPKPALLPVNFQPEGAEVPEGYAMDYGGAFNEDYGYGWIQGPASLGTRDRNNSESPDQSYDTMVHVHPSSIWEAKLPNGSYTVTICMGDPSYPKGIQNVQLENVPVVENELLTKDRRWIEKKTAVEVLDGRLTVTFYGDDDLNRLCWIKIE